MIFGLFIVQYPRLECHRLRDGQTQSLEIKVWGGIDSKLQTSDFEPNMRVLIAPDKFKGTLTAREAADAIARGWQRIHPKDSIELLPISDGGDGFGEVMSALLDARPRRTKTVDAAHRPCMATWWWATKTKTAIIESARVIGLAMLPPKVFHPLMLDTFGLGAVIRTAQQKGAKQIIIGIGGSATNDGGYGLALAMGWKFVSSCDPEINWALPLAISKICPPRRLLLPKILVAVDVQNPLLGSHGATRVFGPQKGLTKEELPVAENSLHLLAAITRKYFRKDFARLPGTGAAGGLGFGLAAFLGARLEPGFDLFARHAKLSGRLRTADLVITGEGAIDRSTLMGKGVGEIARLCHERKIPCIGIAGTATRTSQVARKFMAIHALTDFADANDARANPVFWLERAAATAATNVRADSKA